MRVECANEELETSVEHSRRSAYPSRETEPGVAKMDCHGAGPRPNPFAAAGPDLRTTGPVGASGWHPARTFLYSHAADRLTLGIEEGNVHLARPAEGRDRQEGGVVTRGKVTQELLQSIEARPGAYQQAPTVRIEHSRLANRHRPERRELGGNEVSPRGVNACGRSSRPKPFECTKHALRCHGSITVTPSRTPCSSTSDAPRTSGDHSRDQPAPGGGAPCGTRKVMPPSPPLPAWNRARSRSCVQEVYGLAAVRQPDLDVVLLAGVPVVLAPALGAKVRVRRPEREGVAFSTTSLVGRSRTTDVEPWGSPMAAKTWRAAARRQALLQYRSSPTS